MDQSPQNTDKSPQAQEKSDVYGFHDHNDQKSTAKESQDKQKQVNARIEKWRQMIPNIPKLIHNNDDLLKSRLRKGIPEGVRMLIWPILADVNQMKIYAQVEYPALVNSKEISPYETQIQLDIIRTFQNNHLFVSNSTTSNSLSNVLRALSLKFEKMGYCQGLNYLTACFCLVMSDDMVFWHIYSLLTKYNYIDIYITPKYMFRYFFVFEQLIQQFMPEVGLKLKKYDIVTFYYAQEWFITLFSSILPIKLFLRVMDIFWMEELKVIFRTALAILKIRKDEIMKVIMSVLMKKSNSFEQALKILKDQEFFYNYDQDKFIKIATKEFVFGKDLIKKHMDSFIAKEREDELKKKLQDCLVKP